MLCTMVFFLSIDTNFLDIKLLSIGKKDALESLQYCTYTFENHKPILMPITTSAWNYQCRKASIANALFIFIKDLNSDGSALMTLKPKYLDYSHYSYTQPILCKHSPKERTHTQTNKQTHKQDHLKSHKSVSLA